MLPPGRFSDRRAPLWAWDRLWPPAGGAAQGPDPTSSPEPLTRLRRESIVPLYIYQGRDGERGLELRKQHRESHLAHLSSLDDAGRIRFAGPLIDDQQNPCGSLIVLEADSLAAAREVAESDPYFIEGIFGQLEVFETKGVFPK